MIYQLTWHTNRALIETKIVSSIFNSSEHMCFFFSYEFKSHESMPSNLLLTGSEHYDTLPETKYIYRAFKSHSNQATGKHPVSTWTMAVFFRHEKNNNNKNSSTFRSVGLCVYVVCSDGLCNMHTFQCNLSRTTCESKLLWLSVLEFIDRK